MTDYIKREDAMDGMHNVDDAKHIRALPPADVEPVVRCKDCRDREVCITSDDWYCADAERSRR